ncbi:MAG: heme ABC exporter ATP-binding protein CcmA [Alphaproteobacteria bacterium]|nr:heme ABC exporter ATP-binding protein CcmA [Alphaproteobacteria bacterium]MDE2336769.1 heme ABC exporter ATP-binding protein CcmA [Alphaproteobacteria bacterium]
MTSRYLLKVENLGHSYGAAQIFTRVSFSLAAGEVLQVTGRNGSGKTTLLRLLAGTKPRESGHVTWDEDATRAVLGHKNGIKAELSAIENLSLYAPDRRSCMEALELLGLERAHHKKPCYMLSAGQQRKTALARVMLAKANVWLLDEPFTALDARAHETVTELLARHAKNGGAAVVATHDRLDLDAFTLREMVMS